MLKQSAIAYTISYEVLAEKKHFLAQMVDWIYARQNCQMLVGYTTDLYDPFVVVKMGGKTVVSQFWRYLEKNQTVAGLISDYEMQNEYANINTYIYRSMV